MSQPWIKFYPRDWRGDQARQHASYYGEERRFRYFCGICWRLIKEADDDEGH